jgi:hypothetical protein
MSSYKISTTYLERPPKQFDHNGGNQAISRYSNPSATTDNPLGGCGLLGSILT